MGNHFIYNVKTPINIDQVVNKSHTATKLSLSGGLMTTNLDMNNNAIYNVAQPNGDNQAATKIWSENKFLEKSSGVLAGLLNMSNNKITHLAPATQDGDAMDYKFLNKYTPQGTRLNTSSNRSFSFGDIVLMNIRSSGFNHWHEVPNIGRVRSRYLPKDGSVSMTGDLNMGKKNNQSSRSHKYYR